MAKEEGKKEYELAFILKTEDVSPVTKALKTSGFSVIKEDPVNKVRLAYPIKKESQGFFASYIVSGESTKTQGLTRELELDKEVLRFLILTPNKSESVSAKKAAMTDKTSNKVPETEKVSYNSGKMLSNEALEKKLEEILK